MFLKHVIKTVGWVAGLLGLSTLAWAEYDYIELQPGLAGTWYNPGQSGQGVVINIANAADYDYEFIASWYTYHDGYPLWILGSHAFKKGDESAVLPSIVTRGPDFGANFSSSDVIRTHWGAMTFRFTSCNAGVLEYNSALPEFGVGSLPLVRLTDTAGVSCAEPVDNTSDIDIVAVPVMPAPEPVEPAPVTPVRSGFTGETQGGVEIVGEDFSGPDTQCTLFVRYRSLSESVHRVIMQYSGIIAGNDATLTVDFNTLPNRNGLAVGFWRFTNPDLGQPFCRNLQEYRGVGFSVTQLKQRVADSD